MIQVMLYIWKIVLLFLNLFSHFLDNFIHVKKNIIVITRRQILLILSLIWANYIFQTYFGICDARVSTLTWDGVQTTRYYTALG